MPENKKTAEETTVNDQPELAPKQHVSTATPEVDEPAEDDFLASVQALPTPDQTPAETDSDTTPFDDEKTAEVIGDIVAKEADDLLAAQDAAIGATSIKVPARGNLFMRWWRNKWARGLTFLLIFGGIVAALALPTSRYWALNAAGVRSSSSVVVLDDTTQLPLKGVHFSIGGQEALTDNTGKARIQGLKLGPQELSIAQVGFASVKRQIVVGWGTNPLGNVKLTAVGVQYTIEVRDYLSDKPTVGVEAANGEASALSDKDGKITFTLPNAAAAKDPVSLTKGGYRTEQVTLNVDPKVPTKVALVLARKAVFATKQSGKYDVYKADVDGKNREVLLPGTGSETSNISLVVSPDGNRAALVSTRDNKRDGDGFLLSTLTLINVDTGDTLAIAQAPQIQLIDWIGPRLVFQQVSSDSAAKNRYVVTSYSYTDSTRLQLVAANKLSAVLGAQGVVYYAVAPNLDDPAVQAGLFKIGADGNGKQRVFEDETVTVLRTAYNTLSLQTSEGTWFSYSTSNGATSQTTTPSSLASRLYADNADKTKSLWIVQGTLSSYDVATGKDTVIKSQTGIAYPIQWLSADAAVYRLSVGSETADYSVSIVGGTPHKLSDVAGVYGFAHAQ